MTSSRIKRSEGDNASECNLLMDEGCAEVVEASGVERVGKGGGGRTTNCVCSVCAGVMVIGEVESVT